VPRARTGERLDAAVRALYGFTWNQARDWVASGKVQVNGETPASLQLSMIV
jgi:ribosomal protein S4